MTEKSPAASLSEPTHLKLPFQRLVAGICGAEIPDQQVSGTTEPFSLITIVNDTVTALITHSPYE